MLSKITWTGPALFLVAALSSFAAEYETSRTIPPRPPREFRGLWIATVANIDWPSKPGLSTAAQKAELISILDRAADLHLNTVVFQVRPACDAFYASSIEPWSEYLTGTMGKAPEPYYDPLAFAIEEAHKRGLELHAWFNPYRALHKSHAGRVSPNHISQTRPSLVKRYGQYLWLDPGEREVQDYCVRVVMDVVNRYDIDGVHFDDYFYPDRAESPGDPDFPDQTSWAKYGAHGRLELDDWRRENVNAFIERIYRSIKSAKPWVKFGVSPHGIWRPGNPPQTQKGFDAYATIYADSRKWLANGWVDYFSPQLYWRIDPPELSFSGLLEWWSRQNPLGRHLWPGISVAKARAENWPADEIPNQIRIARRLTQGYLFYNTHSLFADASLTHELERALQNEPAIVPASPWLGSKAPPSPFLSVTNTAGGIRLSWRPTGTNTIRWWLLQTREFDDWKTALLSAGTFSKDLNLTPDAVSITAIDRFGNASPSRVLQLRAAPTAVKNEPSTKDETPAKNEPSKRSVKPPVRKW